jgi:hypothetical protein
MKTNNLRKEFREIHFLATISTPLGLKTVAFMWFTSQTLYQALVFNLISCPREFVYLGLYWE